MRGLSFVCIAVVLFSVFCIGYCFADGVSVNASVDRSNITIGDPINYTITIKKDALLEIELPEIDFGKLEVKDFREENPSEDILDLKYILTSFEVGEFTIPEAAIKYSGGEVKTKAIAIEVVSVLKEEEEYSDIKDLKEQYVIPSEWWIYLIIALAVVALAVAAVFASNYVKRRYFSKEDIVKEVIPLRPPHEVAYEELEVLKKSSLLKEEKIKEYEKLTGDKELVKKVWEDIDALAYTYIWFCLISA